MLDYGWENLANSLLNWLNTEIDEDNHNEQNSQ